MGLISTNILQYHTSRYARIPRGATRALSEAVVRGALQALSPKQLYYRGNHLRRCSQDTTVHLNRL